MRETGSLARNKYPIDNVILVGMPGCGKSTVGVLLAKAMNMRFLDTDLVIQDRTKKLLSQLIAELGIEGFKRLESDICADINVHGTVIATGGSAVFGAKGMEHLMQSGCVVYLHVSLPSLAVRLGDLDRRGVVHAPGQTLADIYAERGALYEKYADITVEEPEKGFDVALVLADTIRALRDGGFF